MKLIDDITERVEKARALGFDGYCTDCESATFLSNSRCGCGSGRVITEVPAAAGRAALQQEPRE